MRVSCDWRATISGFAPAYRPETARRGSEHARDPRDDKHFRKWMRAWIFELPLFIYVIWRILCLPPQPPLGNTRNSQPWLSRWQRPAIFLIILSSSTVVIVFFLSFFYIGTWQQLESVWQMCVCVCVFTGASVPQRVQLHLHCDLCRRNDGQGKCDPLHAGGRNQFASSHFLETRKSPRLNVLKMDWLQHVTNQKTHMTY